MRGILAAMILIVVTTDLSGGESRYYRIACIGDSITMGAYPSELEKLFGGAAEVRVFGRKGAGVSGVWEYTHRALGRWRVPDFVPTHAIWYAGINDCAAEKRSSRRSEYEHVVEVTNNFIEDAFEMGVMPVVVQHHPWDGSRYDRTPIGWSCSQRVNNWLEDEKLMASGAQVVDTSAMGYPEWNCCYIDWTLECDEAPGEFCGNDGHPIICPEEREAEGCCRHGQLRDEYDAGDGLHLNRRGAKALAKMIYEQVDW